MAGGKLIPPLVGHKEAAEILKVSKQHLGVYMKRAEKKGWPQGMLPKPVQTLASGPIWTRKQIEDYRDTRK